ncbi:serine/threonine protein kinase [Scheffersomyces stipitis CBS 6054]|uniref:non-specific serine/threonine protein kinase n=1 Tax=Scheffersomyces stipitis (strain ATCC 58785 / CBS 6054 / NBRC 10063 / NRRL Y-11545) TaxID=322104 RepID=A3LR33_PICST|nr:serine/threonine protein kinase [Scheffersomyces stipitis CBS 6054]ABN65665.2 serine/threonine protein kinase [Scheffersomyces stipitis CBS 6054]
MPVPPPNAYAPGTKLTVGSHQIQIIQYISAGGFAHVYTCHISPAFQGSDIACLKRVAVPSKWQLTLLRQEVDAMRRLRGNKHIVSYIDSHASRMTSNTPNANSDQQYEVFLLMEYCQNNGLIDFMNTRLVNKLNEREIVDIMFQVTIGVAMCHHLRPPLIHRDIKIENVLIDGNGTYKLCDFGSAVGYIAPPKSASELSVLREDIMQHTTPQYRAPEMIDLSKGFPIDDKSDIWALGCFLYKLCYYTTPFESPSHSSLEDMETAILNSSTTLRFRDSPGSMFSARLKNVIKCCLRPDPRRRPNAVQLLGEIAVMRGDSKAPDVVPFSVKESIRKSSKTEEVNAENVDSVKKAPVSVQVQTSLSIAGTKTPDPFASIDKSKLLGSAGAEIPRSKSTHIRGPSADTKTHNLNIYNDEVDLYKHANKSTSALVNYVQSQLSGNQSTNLVSGRRSLESRSDNDTLDFLRNKEEKNHSLKNFARNDTGGSIKLAISHLRKISTGGSINGVQSPAHTGEKPSKRNSVKKILTGGKLRKSSSEASKSDEHDHLRIPERPYPKLSIQKRMQMLKGSSAPVRKSAAGYGKYTDTSAADDIEAINATLSANSTSSSDKIGGPPKVPLSLSSSRDQIVVDKKRFSQPKYKPSGKKGPPPKPKKPVHLKSSETKQRRGSNSSDVSLPDVDDLEKQFSKRFPSYV